MKIAIIIERANISLGGAERSTFELSSRLAVMGHEVQLLAATGTATTGKVKILCGRDTHKRVPLEQFAGAVKEHLEANKYDIIHSTLPFEFADVYQPRGGSVPEATTRNAASYRLPVMRAWKRAAAICNKRRRALAAAEKKLCSNPSGPVIAALSRYVKDSFLKNYEIEKQRIELIPNGIKAHPRPDIRATDRLRGQLMGYFEIVESCQPVFFLFAANNFRLKGLGRLLKAIKIVRRSSTPRPAYLLVAGKSKTAQYSRLAEILHRNHYVRFLGPLKNIQNALAVTDAAVLPSFYDPCSRFILEALAANKPVITTAFNGASERYTDGRHGITIDSPVNIDKLAKSMMHFTHTENIENAKKAIAADNLAQEISIETHCEKLCLLYEKLLRKK